jgi:serine/threonine-protein kinase
MIPDSAPAVSLTIGRYELFEQIASGGMAAVHIGRLKGAVGFSRMVAVKRLHAHLVRDRQFVTMFVDEARLAARIRHPNVVPILDVVQTDAELFLVMDYVQGVSLSRAAALGRKHKIDVPVPVAAAIVADVLHGLHAAHEARDDHGEPLMIVHRDVSPQNVMVGVDGVARVLDFGVAKARGRLQHTAAGTMKGKVAYMAPEQLGGADVGREADLHAAGVILWELLAGRRLHAAATEALVLASVLRGAADPPRKHRPEIPEALDRLVMKALAADPAARFATARDFALALEETTPIAPASQITRWLESVAEEALQQSAVLVAGVDSRPRSFADIPMEIHTLTTPAAPAEKAPPTDRTAVSAGPMPRADTPARVAGAVVLTLLGAVLCAALMYAREPRAPAAGAAPSTPPQPPPTAAASAPPSADPAPTASASAAPPAAEEPRSPPINPRFRRAAPVAPPVAPPAAAPTAPPPAAPPPARTRADCDPPFTIDSRGIQRLKPHCL